METTESTTELRMEARPARSYWLSYLFVTPLAGFVLSAMTIGVVTAALGHDVLRRVHMMEIFAGWTLAVVSFALYIDFRKPYFTSPHNPCKLGLEESQK